MNRGNSTFTRSEPLSGDDTITIFFEETACEVPAGVTVAAALLGHDDHHFCRSAADQEKRAPHCLMGVCFECLVEIDGVKNRQACLEPVREGMQVKRQHEPVDESK
ncbi:(2Fe-2S)-binding protein [Desulfogranum mediterraneum]|uniref:(2Fe-2S)-binding protein n=1 Tax=Desulfogranum mediterraneum TaxID=160661 RepID=UPI00040B862E|nr:(2Fe-2S)-binding protein [Desulfogranum mediterraneum]